MFTCCRAMGLSYIMMYTKGIQTAGKCSAHVNSYLKNKTSGKCCKIHFPLVLYIKFHRKPIDVPQMFYGAPETDR